MDKFIEVIDKPEKINSFSLYCDGACRGNGKINSKSGVGVVIFNKNNDIVKKHKEYLGLGLTNNISEYKSLIIGLNQAIKLNIKHINVYMDSNLVCQQVIGKWRVKNDKLKELLREVKNLKSNFDMFTITHVRREYNKIADQLANDSINHCNFN